MNVQRRIKGYFSTMLMFVLCLASIDALSQSPSVQQLQSQWDEANFALKGDQQIEAFEALLKGAETLLNDVRAQQSSDKEADVLIWLGIIKSSYAGIKGGLGALSLAKSAREDLEKALSIDSKAMAGSAQSSLGTLYANVPGWPVGFGSAKKARDFLKQGVDLDPSGIDSNYFYGVFLLDEKEYPLAQKHLSLALVADARPGREIADKGRRVEISAALAKVQEKLK